MRPVMVEREVWVINCSDGFVKITGGLFERMRNTSNAGFRRDAGSAGVGYGPNRRVPGRKSLDTRRHFVNTFEPCHLNFSFVNLMVDVQALTNFTANLTAAGTNLAVSRCVWITHA